MNKRAVLFVPVSRGCSDAVDGRQTTYCGTIFRIPKDDYGTIRQLEWERTPEELMNMSPAVLAGPENLNRPVLIERFEVRDHENGDVWVMYRVPRELPETKA